MTTETTTPAADGITYDPSWSDVAEASSEAERANKFAPRPVMHTVSVPLTEHEQAGKAVTLAALTQEIGVAKTHLKETAAGLRDEIKALELRQAKVAAEIANGRGDVEVQCTRRVLWETNTVQTTRNDTGEVVDERALTADERQLGMFDDDIPARAELDAEPDDDGDEDGSDIDDPETLLADAAEDEPAPKAKRGRNVKG